MKKRIDYWAEKTGGYRLFFLLILFALLPTLFSSTIIYFLQSYSDWLLQKSTFSFIIFFSGAALAMSLALIPTTLAAILSGYFFDWYGFIGVIVAYLFASIFGLKFGTWMYHHVVGEQLFNNAKAKKFIDKLHHQEFLFVFFGRLSPVFPFSMMNIVFGALRPQFSKYLIASIAGALPRTFLFFYSGKNAVEIWNFVSHPTVNGMQTVVPILLIIISTVGLIWILKSSIDKNLDKP